MHLVRPFVRLTGSIHLRLSRKGAPDAEVVTMVKCTCGITTLSRDDNDKAAEPPVAASKDAAKKSEIFSMAISDKLPIHSLESAVGDHTAAVEIRRAVVSQSGSISQLPFAGYDFAAVHGRCAENVIGYMPIPVGVAGPLVLDGARYFVPMATTEGALIASTCRGIKAINGGGGVRAVVTDDGMTRAPCLHFPSVTQAAAAKAFIDSPAGQSLLRQAFSSTTRHGSLTSVTTRLVGSDLYLRFKARTGEAMGMNMVGKGVLEALTRLQQLALPEFAEMQVGALSANMCADKKAAAINWIEGRGKSVCAEAIIPAVVVHKVLKCGVSELVRLNTRKNLVGSAMAGVSVGGFNAQAANIVAAIFIATGQDPAQVVGSSNCMTLMDE